MYDPFQNAFIFHFTTNIQIKSLYEFQQLSGNHDVISIYDDKTSFLFSSRYSYTWTKVGSHIKGSIYSSNRFLIKCKIILYKIYVLVMYLLHLNILIFVSIKCANYFIFAPNLFLKMPKNSVWFKIICLVARLGYHGIKSGSPSTSPGSQQWNFHF